ncbi:MAG: rod shape-determining protein RodA [Deltaproteobacteria bacterium]|nr:rod shape-determining protein RodA [Candidatus Anaeroferrophillus wilburensis]MBN2888178.1 rod shape-determining protein RodA [Deltaproteobacteria bacterium]
MQLGRKKVSRLDFSTPIITLVLFMIGMLTIYSATYAPETASWLSPVDRRQLAWFFIGLAGMGISFAIDYHMYQKIAYVAYGTAIILLVLVLIIGKTSMGAQRWLTIAGFTFQPSELTKLAVVLGLSRFFAERRTSPPYNLKELLIPFCMVGLPFILVLKQPDLGTALLIVLISLVIIFYAGITRRAIMTLVFAGIAAATCGWQFLHDYQRQRILIFLNPDIDPQGAGYHIAQSKIAVGSGGLWGKGFLKGTQNLLHFLPEQHTDFIFSVFAEQWGFLGAALLISLYLLFLLRGLVISQEAKDPYGSYLAIGITATFFWQFCINIGMVLGLMPVVGIPLPLMSYGGTSLLTSMILVGMLLNIHFRKQYF